MEKGKGKKRVGERGKRRKRTGYMKLGEACWRKIPKRRGWGAGGRELGTENGGTGGNGSWKKGAEGKEQEEGSG